MTAVNQSIAKGQHYKSYHIKQSDVGCEMTVPWLKDRLKLDNYTTALVTVILGRVKYTEPPHDTTTCKVVLPEYEGLALDPFFIAEKVGNLGLADGTILKKILRMGSGDKSPEQDAADILGACEAAKLLFPCKVHVYQYISDWIVPIKMNESKVSV